MNKYRKIIFIVISIFALTAAAILYWQRPIKQEILVAPIDLTSNLKTYRSNEYGFEFKYPSSWIPRTYAEISGNHSDERDFIVGWDDIITGSFLVMKRDVTINDSLADPEIVTVSNLSLDGYDAKLYTYKLSDSKTIIYNNGRYILSFTFNNLSRDRSFDNFVSSFRSVLNNDGNTSPSPTTDSIPQGWKTTESKEMGIKISYPADYTAADVGVIRLDNPNSTREIVVQNKCEADPSGLRLSYTTKDVAFKGMPAKEFVYKQNGITTWLAIQVTGNQGCATLEAFAKYTGDSAEDSRPILETFEFVK